VDEGEAPNIFSFYGGFRTASRNLERPSKSVGGAALLAPARLLRPNGLARRKLLSRIWRGS